LRQVGRDKPKGLLGWKPISVLTESKRSPYF